MLNAMPPTLLIQPPPPLAETPAKRIARQILQRKADCAAYIVSSHQEIFAWLYSSEGVPPADILAELGTNAREIFVRGADIVGFIIGQHTGRPIAQMEPHEYTPPIPITIHDDGTVTINPT